MDAYCKPTFLNIPAEKREKILDIAAREFAQNGYEGTNINVIAAKAGVSVGSLYKYFSTKKDLFLLVVHLGLAEIERTLTGVLDSGESLLGKLAHVIRAIQRTSRETVLIRLYQRIVSQNDAELSAAVARDLERVSAKIYTRLIAEGQRNGEIRADIDPRMAAFLLDNLFMSLQFSYACAYYETRFQVYAGEDILSRDAFVIEQVVNFVQAALGTQSK